MLQYSLRHTGEIILFIFPCALSSVLPRAAGTPLGSSTWGVQVELGMKFLQFSTHHHILSTITTIIQGNLQLSNCSYNSKNSLYSGDSHVGFFSPLCQHREQREGCCDLGTHILKEKIKKPFSWGVCYNPLTSHAHIVS